MLKRVFLIIGCLFFGQSAFASMFPPTIQLDGNVVFKDQSQPPPYVEPSYVSRLGMINSLRDVRDFVCTTLQLTNAPAGLTDDLNFISDVFENYRDDQENIYKQKIFDRQTCYKINPIFNIMNNRVCDMIVFFKAQSKRFQNGSYPTARRILDQSLALLQASFEGQNCDFFGYNSKSFNLFDE